MNRPLTPAELAAAPDDEFCGFCVHHYTRHTYPRGRIVAVTCLDCPDGVCHREPTPEGTDQP